MEIPTVVEVLAQELARCLGKRLVGVYLGGSLSMQDFVPATSDYDILVVMDGVLSPQDLSVLDALHRRLLAQYPDAPRLEGDYVPRHLLVPEGTTAPVPGFLGGEFLPDVADIMLSADNLANMRESGVVVYGPPADAVLPPVTPEHVRAAALDMLLEGPGECATEQAAATEVLNLVRCVFTLKTGRPTTKSEAAAWALSHLDQQWHAVVQRAEAVRRGEPVSEGDSELRSAVPAMYQALWPHDADAGQQLGQRPPAQARLGRREQDDPRDEDTGPGDRGGTQPGAGRPDPGELPGHRPGHRRADWTPGGSVESGA